MSDMDKLGVPDLRGDYVKAGDTIAYAVTQGRSGQLRIGKVIEIVWEREGAGSWGNTIPTKLRVEVETSAFGRCPQKPTLIEAGFKRFVKLG